MATFSEHDKKQIIAALESRGATGPCPRCRTSSFALVEGYFSHFIQTEIGNISLGGQNIPTVVVVCNKCGWIAEHALGSLGLLPKPVGQEKDAGHE